MTQILNIEKSCQFTLFSTIALIITFSLPNLQIVHAGQAKLPQDEHPLAISLPNGVSVQLVGVCSSPRNDKLWWRPDGTPFEIKPYEGWTNSTAVKWAQDRGPERKRYEIALQITYKGTEAVATIWRFRKGDQACIDIGHSPKQNLRSIFIEDYTNAREIDFKVAITADSWQTDCRYTKERQRVDFATEESTGYAVIWQRPMIPEKKYPGKTKLNVIHDFTDEYETRIMLSDINGLIHKPVQTDSNRVKNLTIFRCYFVQPIELVDEFQFQIRPLYWIQFRNVSLSSGHRTKPQVEVCESAHDN